MAEIRLEAAPALGGADVTIGENRIVERSDLALVSVAIPAGGRAALGEALRREWSLGMPDPRQATAAGEMRAVAMTPDQFMLVFPFPGANAEADVRDRLGGAGYTTLQTDAWVVLEVSGPETLPALERLCMLDLGQDRFPPDSAARTVMEHMGAVILRLSEDRFLLMSASSSAASFLHAVQVSYANVTG